MTDDEILREIKSLPPEAIEQLEDFISFLLRRYGNSEPRITPASELKSEAFVGMWRDREDMRDGLASVRNVLGCHRGE